MRAHPAQPHLAVPELDCIITLIRSAGAVIVREMSPADPPATKMVSGECLKV